MSNRISPHIEVDALPEGERESAKHMVHLVQMLADYEARYASACALHLHSWQRFLDLTPEIRKHTPLSDDWGVAFATRKTAGSWCDLAIRDAAFSIFHFYHVLDGITLGARRVPTLFRMMEVAELNKAQPAFKRRFPDPVRPRNAIEHEAEFSKTLDKANKHSFTKKTPFGQITVSGSLTTDASTTGFGLESGSANDLPHSGRVLWQNIEGKLVRAELSPEGVACLKSVVDHVFDAFAPAAKKTWEMAAEAHARSLGISFPKGE